MTHRGLASVSIGVLIAALALSACSQAATSPTSAPPTSNVVPSHTVVYSFGVVGSDGKFPQLEHKTPTPVAGISGTVVQIATSNSDSYALTSTGTVWAWGAGAEGELGNGSTIKFVRRPVRVEFPAGVKISSLPNPTPFDAGLAIDSRGDVWGWGNNAGHALCLPGKSSRFRPTRLPLTHVTLATGARSHTLFDSNAKVYACGQGSDGELGDGSTTDRSTPVAVLGLPRTGVKSLVSSWQGSGALMDNGSYYDWGFNQQGELGDRTRANSSIPVRVHLPAAVAEVSQGGSRQDNGQTLAILADGSVWAWGDGRWGQLGIGRSKDSPVPVRVKLRAGLRFDQVSSGGFSCYAIDSSGTLWVWGRNEFGQLGEGDSATSQLLPLRVRVRLSAVSSTATNVAGLSAE